MAGYVNEKTPVIFAVLTGDELSQRTYIRIQ